MFALFAQLIVPQCWRTSRSSSTIFFPDSDLLSKFITWHIIPRANRQLGFMFKIDYEFHDSLCLRFFWQIIHCLFEHLRKFFLPKLISTKIPTSLYKHMYCTPLVQLDISFLFLSKNIKLIMVHHSTRFFPKINPIASFSSWKLQKSMSYPTFPGGFHATTRWNMVGIVL